MMSWISHPTGILLGVIVGLVAYLYYKAKYGYNYLKEQGIPGPTPLPLFGTALPLFQKGIIEHDLSVRKKYGKVVRLFDPGQDILVVSDEDILRNVLVKDFNIFNNRRGAGKLEGVLGALMTVLEDDHWKRVRSTLTPTFSSGKLKRMFGSINECSTLLVDNLGRLADEEEEFDGKEVCGAFNMDVIARTVFGISINTWQDQENEFVTNAKKSMNINLRNPFLILATIFPPSARLLAKLGLLKVFDMKSIQFFVDIVDQLMESHKESNDSNRSDFIKLMMNAHSEDFDVDEVSKEAAEDGIIFEKDQGPKKGLSKLDIQAQGFIFFLAGYDTTSNALSLLLYNLACNPTCQAKAQEEIDDVLGDKTEVTYDDVQSMSYLDQCLQESMRLYPAAPRVDRVAAADTTVKGINIRKGTVIVASILNMHMDPEIWPEPDKYDPERFSPEERARHSPFDHMPFGYGPRNCIAMRLALVIVKLGAARILRNFNVVTCERTQIPLKFANTIIQRTEKGVWLKVQRR